MPDLFSCLYLRLANVEYRWDEILGNNKPEAEPVRVPSCRISGGVGRSPDAVCQGDFP